MLSYVGSIDDGWVYMHAAPGLCIFPDSHSTGGSVNGRLISKTTGAILLEN